MQLRESLNVCRECKDGERVREIGRGDERVERGQHGREVKWMEGAGAGKVMKGTVREGEKRDRGRWGQCT